MCPPYASTLDTILKQDSCHAVWAVRNLLQESGAGDGGASPMLSDFFVHKQVWSYGYLDTATKILLQIGKSFREIGRMRVQWVHHIHAISNGNAPNQ